MTINIKGKQYVVMPALSREFTARHNTLSKGCFGCALNKASSQSRPDCSEPMEAPDCVNKVFVEPDKVEEYDNWKRIEEMGL